MKNQHVALASCDPSRGMQSKNPGGQHPEAEPRMRQKKIIGRSNLQKPSSGNLQSLKNNQATPKQPPRNFKVASNQRGENLMTQPHIYYRSYVMY